MITFPDSSVGKESTCYAGDCSLIPGLGISPGEEICYPLQYSGLENPMDCIVHWSYKESDMTITFTFTSWEKKFKGYIMKNLLIIWPLHSIWRQIEWTRGKVPLKMKIRAEYFAFRIHPKIFAWPIKCYMAWCLPTLLYYFKSVQPNQSRSLVFARNALMQDLHIISFFYFCLDLYAKGDCFGKNSW